MSKAYNIITKPTPFGRVEVLSIGLFSHRVTWITSGGFEYAHHWHWSRKSAERAAGL